MKQTTFVLVVATLMSGYGDNAFARSTGFDCTCQVHVVNDGTGDYCEVDCYDLNGDFITSFESNYLEGYPETFPSQCNRFNKTYAPTVPNNTCRAL